jgi:hypothetical protein
MGKFRCILHDGSAFTLENHHVVQLPLLESTHLHSTTSFSKQHVRSRVSERPAVRIPYLFVLVRLFD